MTDALTSEVYCTVVPDGAITSAGSVRLRISLVLWPRPVAGGAGAHTVGLVDWPTHVAADQAGFWLKFHAAAGAETFSLFQPAPGLRDFRAKAQSLWREVITDAGCAPDAFGVLHQVLTDVSATTTAGTGDPADPKVGRPDAPTSLRHDIRETATSTLAEQLVWLHTREAASDVFTALGSQSPALMTATLNGMQTARRSAGDARASDRLSNPLDRRWRLEHWRHTYSGALFGMRPLGDSLGNLDTTLVLQAQAQAQAQARPQPTGSADQSGSPPPRRASEEAFQQAKRELAQRFVEVQDDRLARIRAVGQPGSSQDQGDASAGEQTHFLRRSKGLRDEAPSASGDRIAQLLMLDPSPAAITADDQNLLIWNLAATDTALESGVGDRPPENGAFDEAAESPESLMRRRLSALSAQPSIRKSVNLIVDLEVTISLTQLDTIFTKGADGRHRGRVSAGFSRTGASAGVAMGPATAVVLQPGPGAQRSVFEPCPELEFGPASTGVKLAEGAPALHDGVVNLRTGRFRLETVDAVNAAYKMQASANSIHEQDRAGLAADQIETDTPEIATRGLMLCDQEAARQTTGDLASGRGVGDLLFAEDLVEGYRVDILYGDKTQAYPITARRLTYPGLTMPDWFDEPRFRSRDDGFVMSTPREVAAADGTGAKVATHLLVNETLFTWSGESLGVPGLQFDEYNKPRSSVRLQPGDLMIDTSYALPDVSAALRVGAGVRVGLRVRKTNGASVDIAVAETLYETFALGRGGNAKKDEAYVFRPTERTRAPDLLLSRRDSPLARAPSVDTPGEAEIVMVIRSGSVLPRDADHRVLMPQKTSFDRAEQYGQLDADDDYAEQGAFTAVNLEKDGQYPVLRRNGSTTTDGKLFSANAEPATNRKNPFFPDPAGRRLGVAITRDGRSLSTFEGRAPDLAFWDEDPAAAAPIYLKLQKRKGIGGTFFRGFDGAEELRGQQLHVELGPAEEVDLHLWTFDDFKNTRQRHRLAALAFDRIIWATGKTEAELEELWDQFASLAPVPALQDRLTLKLVHALDRPTRKPAFTRALRAFPISGQPNGPGSWKEVRALIFAPEGSRDPEHLAIQAQPRSSVVQFAGAVDLDRASTGAARIELSWLEFSRVGAARPLGSAPAPDGAWPTAGDAPTRYVFAPARGAHVFELPTIARGGGVSGVDPDADIILEDDYLDTYRLIHTFPDRQARRLVVRSVATSRFLTYLPPVTAAAFGPLGPYEQESLSSNGVKQRLANPGLSDAHVIWIPASSPPPPLTITSPPQPAQFQGQRAVAGGVEITWSQPTRIWLDDWPVAEGMLVGVICKPANLFDVRKPRYDAANPHRYLLADTTSSPAEAANNSRLRSKAGMEDFDALPKWLNDVVTQWGGNPNTNAGASVFITQNRFSGYVASAGNLMLPKGKASGDDPGAPDADCAAEAVAVVGYEAQFDAAVGRWFCDIALDTDGWHEPGVRFGLARYQPHALPGCELSPATAVSPIAVSAPRVVTITRSVDRVIVTIRGSGFTDRATSVDGQLDAHGLAELYGALAPMMCIRFQRVVDGSPFGKIEEREVGSPSGSSWSVEFEIPESERGKRLAILVHEYVLDGVALAGQRGEVGLENSLVKRLLGFEVNAII